MRGAEIIGCHETTTSDRIWSALGFGGRKEEGREG